MLGPDALLAYFDSDKGNKKHLGAIDVCNCSVINLGTECAWIESKAGRLVACTHARRMCWTAPSCSW